MYDFDTALNRKGTNSIKWDEKAIDGICGNSEAKAFWVADMDLVTSHAIHSAIKEAADFGVVGYPRDQASLIPLFSSFMKARHNTVIDEKLTTYAMGMLHGIALAMALFSKEGDGVYVPTPTYRPFMEMVENQKRTFLPSPLAYRDGVFSLDINRFRKDSENAKIILFCSPHNPSGLVFKREELEAVLKSAKERDQIVLCDEIHADLVHEGVTHIPMIKANEKIGAKCITFFAPSKTFNVAGEHFAFGCFSDKALFDAYQAAQKALFLTSPGYFSLEIGKAAYGASIDHNLELASYLKGNVAFIREYLKDNISELKMTNAEASFVCFIDCSAILDKVKKLSKEHPENFPDQALLSHFFGHYAGLCFNDGTWFGSDYGAFIRFNYGTSRSEVEYALKKMKEAIAIL